MTSIGHQAFSNCESLINAAISNGVTTIGGDAFSDCDSLTSVVIPDSVTSIGYYAFGGCGNIDKIDVSSENKVYYGVNNCLIEKSTKMLILGCKNSIIPSDGSVTTIGENAFAGCSGLTAITIPDSITDIEIMAFLNCNNLVSVTIPNSMISVEVWAFLNCGTLTEVIFKGTIEKWKKIYTDGIFAGTQVSTVKCTDGDVEI